MRAIDQINKLTNRQLNAKAISLWVGPLKSVDWACAAEHAQWTGF